MEDGRWRERHLTGSTVWGATRAYRRACLDDGLPFEERLGWDGIDEFKANARGTAYEARLLPALGTWCPDRVLVPRAACAHAGVGGLAHRKRSGPSFLS